MYMLERILWGCFSCVSVFFVFTEPGDTSQFLVIPRIPHASTLLWYTHTPRWLTIKLNETNFNANVECILFNGSHWQQVKKGIPLVRAVWHEWMLCFRSSYWHRKNSSNKSIAKLHDFYVNQYYVVTADANIGINSNSSCALVRVRYTQRREEKCFALSYVVIEHAFCSHLVKNKCARLFCHNLFRSLCLNGTTSLMVLCYVAWAVVVVLNKHIFSRSQTFTFQEVSRKRKW